MTNEQEVIELFVDRMRVLEEALQRAETGAATPDDWVLIRAECGMPKSQFLSNLTRNKHESYSV
jgi:hypothetical protein